MNFKDAIYCYVAIGGIDLGEIYEIVITKSGNWTVPLSGRYYLELYGGGGSADGYGITRSSSCQSFDSINLTKREIINVSIGIGATYPSQATGTSFG